MKRLIPAIVSAIVLMASPTFVAPAFVQPALAQTKLAPKPATARTVDNCAPIGRTANGTLVYSMKCDNLPAPPPPPQAEAAPAPPPEPEVQRTGILGLSYSRKPPDQ
jgi:outer membrane biosynthesis protein TonB